MVKQIRLYRDSAGRGPRVQAVEFRASAFPIPQCEDILSPVIRQISDSQT
jgi:hypothetical protein